MDELTQSDIDRMVTVGKRMGATREDMICAGFFAKIVGSAEAGLDFLHNVRIGRKSPQESEGRCAQNTNAG